MLVSVLSVKGSPGVTSFAVALAARWPAPARTVVVEADPSGGDLGPRFSLPVGAGLTSLAAAARQGGDAELVWSHTQQLPGGLAVVAASPDADQARAALAALVPDTHGSGITGGPATRRGVLREAADAPDTVVVVDCGRADPGSPALSIARSSDAVILLSRANADDLAHLPRRLDTVGGWSPIAVLLLVGKGYPIATVARELGVAPLGRVPHDPVGAEVLCGRPNKWRWGRGGPSRSALGNFAHTIAATLDTRARPATPDVPVAVLRAVPGAPTVAVPNQRPHRTGAGA